jgi:hypothetical protein
MTLYRSYVCCVDGLKNCIIFSITQQDANIEERKVISIRSITSETLYPCVLCSPYVETESLRTENCVFLGDCNEHVTRLDVPVLGYRQNCIITAAGVLFQGMAFGLLHSTNPDFSNFKLGLFVVSCPN